MMVKCAWCGKEFDKPIKRVNQTVKLGKQHACSRKCASCLTNEERRCTPSTPNAEHTRRDKEKFPEKDRARYLVRQALKSGKLIPPDECELCYDECRPEAHHPDHLRPFFLVFLCKKCHAYADTQPGKLEEIATEYSPGV